MRFRDLSALASPLVLYGRRPVSSEVGYGRKQVMVEARYPRGKSSEVGYGRRQVSSEVGRHSSLQCNLQSFVNMVASLSTFSSARPEPRTTQVRGSSATMTGSPVSSISSR